MAEAALHAEMGDTDQSTEEKQRAGQVPSHMSIVPASNSPGAEASAVSCFWPRTALSTQSAALLDCHGKTKGHLVRQLCQSAVLDIQRVPLSPSSTRLSVGRTEATALWTIQRDPGAGR
ncbi:hypothetical protein GCM10023220_55850 [Streptomyces ziwulingensis]|uniref:Uncharacterized protein n=1 Tax=Streptomyces ziwulingensis TaxID=1045501 RepID=A0ABP9CQP5_9ACTN